MKLVAVYGTLREKGPANALMNTTPMASGMISGYDVECPSHSNGIETYANTVQDRITHIMAAPRHGSYPAVIPISASIVEPWFDRNNIRNGIFVEVYNVSDETIARLDAYEGFPNLYVKGRVLIDHQEISGLKFREGFSLSDLANHPEGHIYIYVMNAPISLAKDFWFIPSGDWSLFDRRTSIKLSSLMESTGEK